MPAHPSRQAGCAGSHWLARAAEMADLERGNWRHSPDSAPVDRACLPRIATRTPGVDAGAVRAARAFTIATLQRWGVAERSEDIAVVVSELLTNAVQHALPDSAGPRPRWPIRLGLLQPGPCVLCAVADPSEMAPVPKTPVSLAETGRGLPIICALSDRWGYAPLNDMGKVVWAMFSTRLAAPGTCKQVIRQLPMGRKIAAEPPASTLRPSFRPAPRTFAERVVAEDSRRDLRPTAVDDVTVDCDTPAPASQYE